MAVVGGLSMDEDWYEIAGVHPATLGMFTYRPQQIAADDQQEFSSHRYPTLHLTIPALEQLHSKWKSHHQK